MPNWCNNTIVVKGDADKIDALKKAVIDHKMLDHMMPMPKELKDSEKYPADGSERPDLVAKYGASCWYDWAVNNWQTKWDTGVEDETSISEEDLGDGRKQISFWFDSAWSPPIGAYEHYLAHNNDIDIRATYYEPGCDFAGIFEDNYDNGYTLSDITDAQLRGDLSELDDHYGILESREEWRVDMLTRDDKDVDDEDSVKEFLKSQAELNDQEMEDYITEVRKEYA